MQLACQLYKTALISDFAIYLEFIVLNRCVFFSIFQKPRKFYTVDV